MLTAPEVPNLDAMSRNELMAFWQRHHTGCQSRLLFHDGGTGTKRATADLANYASNKATAMGLRMEGKIQAALQYESIADNIYNRLPEWARW